MSRLNNERFLDALDAARDRSKERRLNPTFDDYSDPGDAPSKSTLTEEEINELVRLHRNREGV